MPGPRSKTARRPIAALVAVTLTVAACGGAGTEEQSDTTTSIDEAATSTTESMAPTTQPSEPTSETTAASSAAIEVDPSALPSDPSGYDTWSADLCSLYTAEQLDAFFMGSGELATTEPLDQGCRWAVDGFPRSHYVDIVVVSDGTDSAYQLDQQVEIADTTIDLGHGPEDLVVMVPTPDGAFLRILIHGGFEAPPGPLGDYLNGAGTGLAENLISRY